MAYEAADDDKATAGDAAKKGIAALIVAKMKPVHKEDPDSPEANDNTQKDDEYTEEGKLACAEDMMRCMQEQDAKGFMQALEDYLAHR